MPPTIDFQRRRVGDRIYFNPITDTGRGIVRSIQTWNALINVAATFLAELEGVYDVSLITRDFLVEDPWRYAYGGVGLPRRPFLRVDTINDLDVLWMPVDEFQETGEDLP